jgi:6-pyruvoyltetrahydropterin/6-carboxytetrahydropterin synthase
MVMDLAELDALLHRLVVERFDHKHLNYDVAEFAFGAEVPTAEALAVHVWDLVERELPRNVQLKCVRIQEDPHLYAEYCGEP